jgi:hypothetical protein
LLRLIIFFAVLYIVVTLLTNYRVGRKIRTRRSDDGGPAPEAEETVFDPQCQSYVAKKDAIYRGGGFFCSEECAQLYLSR